MAADSYLTFQLLNGEENSKFNSVKYWKSNKTMQEFWERFRSNLVSRNEFVHRLMSYSLWNHIACLYYILTVESKWLNSCISLKIKKYFKSHHVLPFFRCYFHLFCSLCINYDLQYEKKGWRTNAADAVSTAGSQTTTNDKRPYIDRQCGSLPAVPHNIKTNVYS